MLDTYGRRFAERFITPGAKLFQKLNWSPTQVTLLACAVGLFGALTVLWHWPVGVSIALLWLSGYLDTVDGSLARRTGRTSAIGTLLDIFLDRVVELSYIIALVVREPDAAFSSMLLCASITLSMTVFLTAGNLLKNTGVKTFRYQTGLMERTDGFILTTAMLALKGCLKYTAAVYAALILFTAIQRLAITIWELREDEKTMKEQ
ncbi:MAG: CDP-alcohol phosphatidyltransferase family protein [Clostridia bacterium]|nr:CDP-alcohol phosphatidyltransferase family protein [Clostridia bacterium]